MKEFKLDNEPKITSGFIIPDTYFDTLSEKITAKLSKQEPKFLLKFISRKKWYYSAAAIVLLTLTVTIFTKYSTKTEEIDNITLENYLAYQSTISEDEIVNLLDQEDLDKMKMEFNFDDASIEDALKSNTNLEQYIIY